ncbi:unnamed protein product, partial [Closterium sp. NIES-53]
TSPLNGSTPTSTTAAATTPTAATTTATTPTTATTAATKATTPATTPTATSATSTASTTTTPSATSNNLASLSLAFAVLPTRRKSSPNLLSTKDVNSSRRSVGGGKGGGGTPLKEGCARSATSSTYNDYASLSCKEVLLEQVNSEWHEVGAVAKETVGRTKFTRYPFSSSEATAKAPLDEVVMDVVGPLKLGAAGA